MPDSDGPYLIMAVLCEKVLIEPDGVSSLIRVVDRVTVSTPMVVGAPSPDFQLPQAPISLTLAMMFKSGKARGEDQLMVRLWAPNGTRIREMSQTVNFEGDDDRGVAVFLPVVFNTGDPGLYWFELLLKGQPIARTPLRILRQEGSMVTPPQL
jgi:hypothetical protein